MIRTSKSWAIVSGVASLAIVLSACGGGQEDSASGSDGTPEAVSGEVAVDGSSTVFPLSDAAAELLNEENPDIKVTVGEAGTGGGFELFCQGKTDVSNASRPIKADEEAPVCADAGIEYTELQVASDALTMVVPTDFGVDCLTTEQLAAIWGKDSKVKNWKEVDPAFPDQELKLFGPGSDSGTFDYFTDVINGEEGVSRTDYEASEDDNVIAQGVGGTEGALGYFGYTYYEENTDTLKALEVDSGSGCVAPSAETAADGSYTPLSRPLFIYVNNAGYADKPQVKAYIDFYVENLTAIAEVGKYIALNDEQYTTTKTALDGLAG
ncbi:MAG: PstS family phosphate ABC transporter substrate-binding protein [Nocardioides sp.]